MQTVLTQDEFKGDLVFSDAHMRAIVRFVSTLLYLLKIFFFFGGGGCGVKQTKRLNLYEMQSPCVFQHSFLVRDGKGNIHCPELAEDIKFVASSYLACRAKGMTEPEPNKLYIDFHFKVCFFCISFFYPVKFTPFL